MRNAEKIGEFGQTSQSVHDCSMVMDVRNRIAEREDKVSQQIRSIQMAGPENNGIMNNLL